MMTVSLLGSVINRILDLWWDWIVDLLLPIHHRYHGTRVLPMKDFDYVTFFGIVRKFCSGTPEDKKRREADFIAEMEKSGATRHWEELRSWALPVNPFDKPPPSSSK